MYSGPKSNLGSNKPYAEIERNFLSNLKDFYLHPTKYRLAPFRIFGNLYYIGDKKVCIHLIDTGDGLIVFDGGYPHTTHLLIQSILDLGFSPADVRYMICSHGHFDHMGAAEEFREMYDTKIFLSRVDNDYIEKDPDFALYCYGPHIFPSIPAPDALIEDGDVITLGNTSIRCVLSPGHTPGTMSFFFDAVQDGETKQVGYMGGLGFLSLFKEMIEKYHYPADIFDQLADTVTRLRKENPEIVIGNHPTHNCTLEKREWMLQHPEDNPFIDSDTWQAILDQLAARREGFLQLGY